MQVNALSSNNDLERVAAYEAEADSPFLSLPPEILKMIFSYLSTDLGHVAKVCKSWQKNANAIIQLKDKETLEKYGAFEAAEWAEYFGMEVKAPLIPRGLFAWLDRPSVKTEGPDGKNGETGLFFLMPEGLSLNSIGELAQKATGAWQTKYIYSDDEVKNRYGKNSVGTSYWVWMSKALLLDSRRKNHDEQKTMVKELGDGYELPKVLEAVVLNIALYVSHAGERLFSDNRWTYTRCQEVIERLLPLIVGRFAPDGFHVHYDYLMSCDASGVAACRKF